jgi:hypothetical protein
VLSEHKKKEILNGFLVKLLVEEACKVQG